MQRSRLPLWILLALSVPLSVAAQGRDSTMQVVFGAFLDAYYGFDAGRPATGDRRYTTQAARANEFNVNLVHVEAVARGARVRGRLALQAGTSIQVGDATSGSVSVPPLSRHIQEAYVGYRFSDRVWVDAGIFFSNIGAETWISSDNITYTRSLVADFSPYYSSGVRAVVQATPKLVARVDVINGWENVVETNASKAIATRIDYALRERLTLSHYVFAGSETRRRMRLFTGVSALAAVTPGLEVEVEFDVGRQSAAEGEPAEHWLGGVIAARSVITPRTRLVLRGEWYRDPAQAIVLTYGPDPFQAEGGSVGIDFMPGDGFMWRTELRALFADAPLFAHRDRAGSVSNNNLLLVTAFTLRL